MSVDRLERLVLDPHGGGGAARLLGLLGRDERDRLAEVAHAVEREHGLVGELEAVGLLSGHVLVGEHRVDAGHRARPATCRSRRCARARAGCGRSSPRASRPRGGRSSTRTRRRPWARRRCGVRPRRLGRAEACGSGSWSRRSRQPDGVEDLRVAGAAAEIARERLADLVVRRAGHARRAAPPSRRRAPACRSRTGRRRPRRTPAARGAAPRPRAGPRPSSPRGRRPGRRERGTSRRARRRAGSSTSRTRPARTRSSSPGRPSRSRSALSRLSPGQTSASCRSPLIVSAIFTRGTVAARAAR